MSNDISGILQRLLLVYRWVGFLCLIGWHVLWLGFLITARFVGEDVIEVLGSYFEILIFERGYDTWPSLIAWAGLTYWPIHWLLTGSKTFLPWRKESSNG